MRRRQSPYRSFQWAFGIVALLLTWGFVPDVMAGGHLKITNHSSRTLTFDLFKQVGTTKKKLKAINLSAGKTENLLGFEPHAEFSVIYSLLQTNENKQITVVMVSHINGSNNALRFMSPKQLTVQLLGPVVSKNIGSFSGENGS